MTLTSIYANNIIYDLTNLTLPMIIVEPTCEQLIQIHKKLCANE